MRKTKKRTKTFFQRFWDAFWRPEMLILPGQITFFLFLSLVPTITVIGYVCSYLNISNDLIATVLSNSIGINFSNLLTPIITDTKITPTFFITLGFGYFIASNGMSSIIVASNTIYGIKDQGFFKRRLKAIVMEIIIVFLLLFILVVPLLGNSIINLLHYFNLDVNTTEIVVNTLKFLSGPFSWLVIYFFIKIIYAMAPDKKIPSRNVTGGAIFTTIGWILITSIYSYYIEKYANYSIFYGGLANIVVLMLWVYLLSYIFVIGMAMNYHEELERTGIIDVQNVIKESANSAPVLPEDNAKEKIEKESTNQEQKEDKKEIPDPKEKELNEDLPKKKNTKKKTTKETKE